jgi:DNA-directed RNA polymerase, mitochondrial
MLGRAARQRDVLHHLRLSADKRTLGRFYPVFRKSHSQLLSQGLTDSTPSSAQSTNHIIAQSSFQAKRTLATTTDFPISEHEYDIPFEGLHGSLLRNYDPLRTYLPSLPHFGQTDGDPSSSIVILDALPQTRPRILRKINGLGGDASEMLANFDVSIKVGKFERAATLLQRLCQFYAPGSQEYLELHNTYLLAMVAHMLTLRLTDLTRPLQRWFEVKLPQVGVKPDATTYAAMLRMALRMLHGSKRDRTVRRYWEMVKYAKLEEDVLSLPVLTDTDLGQLNEVSPNFFLPSHLLAINVQRS